MCGEFGEVTVIIGLVINFLAFISPLCAFRDTSSYARGPIGANSAMTRIKQKIAVSFNGRVTTMQ